MRSPRRWGSWPRQRALGGNVPREASSALVGMFPLWWNGNVPGSRARRSVGTFPSPARGRFRPRRGGPPPTPPRATPDTAPGSARARRGTPRPSRAPARSGRPGRTVAATARVHVWPDAGRDAAEDRGAERGALVDRDALERQLEHRGDDREPQLAARATAGHAPERRARRRARAIRSSESRKPERDALEHGAHERAAIVAQRQPGERRRERRGRRAACARRRGRGGTSAPRCRRARLTPPSVRASYGVPGAIVSRSQRSEPAADSITPIACQAPGTAWQNACTRPAPSAANASQRGEHDPRRAERDRQRPRPVDADAERARRLVARARGHRHAVGRVPRDRPGSRAPAAANRGSSSSAVSTSSLQRRAATSSSSVPDASETSVACSPHRRSRT